MKNWCARGTAMAVLTISLCGCSSSDSTLSVQSETPTTANDSPTNETPAANPNVPAGTFDSGLASDAFLLTLSFTRDDREFHRMNANTGGSERVFIRTPDGLDEGLASTRPDIVGQSVFVSGRDNSLNAFDIDTGRSTGYAPIGEYGSGWDVGSPVCIDSICYVRGGNGVILAFEPETDTLLWENDVSSDPSYQIVGGSDPVLYNGKIYVVTYSDEIFDPYPPTIHVLNADTGVLENELRLPMGVRPVSLPSNQVFEFQPIIVGNLLLINGEDLIAYNADTMQLVWRADLYGASVPVFAGGLIVAHTIIIDYPADQRSHLVGIDPLSGSIVWERAIGLPEPLYVNPVSDGMSAYTKIIQCSAAGCPHSPAAFDGATGQLIWVNSNLNSNDFNSPLLAGNALFFEHIETTTNSNWAPGVGMISKFDGSLQWTNDRLGESGLGLVKSADTVYRLHFNPSH